MNTQFKSTEQVLEFPAGKIGISEASLADIVTLLLRHVERIACLEKHTLDTLSWQTAETRRAVQQVLQATPAAPWTAFLDLMEQAVDEWIGAQEEAVDLLIQNSAHMLLSVQEGTSSAFKTAARLVEALRQWEQRSTAAQNMTLDLITLQSKVVSEAGKWEPDVEGTPFAAATCYMQQALSGLVQRQRRLLAS